MSLQWMLLPLFSSALVASAPAPAPAPSPFLNLAESTLLSRSNNSAGTISVPLQRHYKNKKRSHGTKRDGQLGQVNLINAGLDLTYLGEIQIGTPPQTLKVEIDTGSSVLMVEGPEYNSPANTDLGQNHYSASYDPYKSSTISSSLGDFDYHYVDRTFFRADLFQDTVTLGGYQLANAPFGIATSGNITFAGTGSGIIGLGLTSMNSQIEPQQPADPSGQIFGTNDSTFTIPLVEQLWHLGALNEPLFSFNIVHESGNPEAGHESPGGELLLGGVDESLFEGDIAYSPVLVDPVFSTDYPSSWKATIQGVSINGNLLPNSQFDAIFDTGSTASLLPFSLVNNIFSQINTTKYPVYTTSDDPRLPVTKWSFECPDGFPDSLVVTFIFGNSQFDIPFSSLVFPTKYFFDGKIICAFKPGSLPDDSQLQRSVIGSGLGKLSSRATSQGQSPSDLDNFSTDTISQNGSGPETATSISLFTPTPKLAGTSFVSVDNPSAYWDITTMTLPLQPTILGTASILSPAFTSVQTPKGSGDSNRKGDPSGSKSNCRGSHLGLSVGFAIAISGFLVPLFVL